MGYGPGGRGETMTWALVGLILITITILVMLTFPEPGS